MKPYIITPVVLYLLGWIYNMQGIYLLLGLAMVYMIVGSVMDRRTLVDSLQKTMPLEEPVTPRDVNQKGYSHRQHYSQRVRRMAQKAKDAELERTVTSGNRQWAQKQNEAAKKMQQAAQTQAHAAGIRAVGGYGSYQQAAWTDQFAAMQMQQAAADLADAADAMDPFERI